MTRQSISADSFPYANSLATEMLSDGMRRLRQEEGVNMTALASRLHYRQPVVLSHMAAGRVPIPIDRAIEFADALGLSKTVFLKAVLEQRHPSVDWSAWSHQGDEERLGGDAVPGGLVATLEQIAGGALDELTPDQARVMREVAADRNAGRRWLTVHEVEMIELIRKLAPAIQVYGLLAAERQRLTEALRLPDG
jgi:hypothetical protein